MDDTTPARVGSGVADAAALDHRRHDVLDALWTRRHELARELIEQYRREIVDYHELPDAVLSRDVAEGAAQNIEGLVDAFRDGFEVEDLDPEWLRRSAARRVHQRVRLPSLLRTFRIWGNHLWQAIVTTAGDDEIGRVLAVEAAGALWTYVDRLSTAATISYTRESSTVVTGEQVLPMDLLETLLTGEAVNERARRQSAVLTMNLRERLAVVVLQVPSQQDQPVDAEAAIRSIQNSFSAVTRSLLVGARDTEVIGICGLDADDDVDNLHHAADELAVRSRGVVGVGRIQRGSDGLRRSYAEAHEASVLASPHGLHDCAIRFTDVLLDRLLRSARYTDALLEETVGPLVVYDRERKAPLLSTLRAYVDANFNLSRAASALTVNPNTVVYRLRRIRELTGRDTGTVDDLLLLALGLRLYDLAPPLQPGSPSS